MRKPTDQYSKEVEECISWLKRSFAVNQGRGSSAYYQMYIPGLLGKWSKPYPETSGYLIPTILRILEIQPDPELLQFVNSTVDWLLDIQRDNGAFPGGIGTSGPDSVFNTAQIMFGLNYFYQKEENQSVFESVHRARTYLLDSINDQGEWTRGFYVDGYTPAYYSRVLWQLTQIELEKNKRVDLTPKLLFAIDAMKRNIHAGRVYNVSFDKNKMGLNHTLAYTLRGFLEIGHLLKDEQLINTVKSNLDILLQYVDKTGKFPSRVDAELKPDFHFICPVGEFQFSIICSRMAEILQQPKYHIYAKILFEMTSNNIWRKGGKNKKGGIPGSKPIYGPYQRGRLINWGTKFYLDALLYQFKA